MLARGNGQPNGGVGGAWNAFWAGAGGAGALADADKAQITGQFWTDVLAAEFRWSPPARFADLACGAGVLGDHAASIADSLGHGFNALFFIDYSAAAAVGAAAAWGGLGVSADLAALPLADGALDFAVSQYGIEYADERAFREAARVLAPGGVFLALIHDAQGGVAAECGQNRACFDRVAENGVIARARTAFVEGYAASRTSHRRDVFIEADRRFRPALEALGKAAANGNSSIAATFLRQVHRDLHIMYARRWAYAERDVMQWLDNIENEIVGYRARMETMLAAARNQAQMIAIAKGFSEAGCEVARPRRILSEPGGVSVGWALRVIRPAI